MRAARKRQFGLEERRAEGRTDSEVLRMLVHQPLDIGRNGARALVEDSKLGQVIKQPCDSHLPHETRISNRSSDDDEGGTDPLLLSTTEDVLPLLARVESSLPRRKVRQVHVLEDIEQLRLGSSSRDVIGVRMRVDDPARFVSLSASLHTNKEGDVLIPQTPCREVRPLRQEEDVLVPRPPHDPLEHGPQARQHPRDARLATPVRSRDHQMLPRKDLDAQTLDQFLSSPLHPRCRRDDRDLVEFDALDGSALDELAVNRAEVVEGFVGSEVSGTGEGLEVVRVEVVEGREEGVHARSVAGEFGEVLPRVHEATTGVGEGKEETTVRDVACVSGVSEGRGKEQNRREDALSVRQATERPTAARSSASLSSLLTAPATRCAALGPKNTGMEMRLQRRLP